MRWSITTDLSALPEPLVPLPRRTATLSLVDMSTYQTEDVAWIIPFAQQHFTRLID